MVTPVTASRPSRLRPTRPTGTAAPVQPVQDRRAGNESTDSNDAAKKAHRTADKVSSAAGKTPTSGGKALTSSKAPADVRDNRIDLMLEGVRTAGLKLTPQRIAIVRALAADPSHPTAQEIFDRLQSSLPTMSFATVYNTLDALTTAGLCGSLSLSPGPARFDPNMAPHHHAVCDGCGLVRDVARPTTGAGVAELARTITRLDETPALSGFEVRAVEHIYRGLCAMCSARERTDDTGQPRDARLSTQRA